MRGETPPKRLDRAAQLVGICTRTDVLRARRTQLEMEQRQRGWRPAFKRNGQQTG